MRVDELLAVESRPIKCINLKKRFGARYKVRCEESYRAEHGVSARAQDPWLMILLCQYGHIFPWGGSVLAASVDGHTSVSAGCPAAAWSRTATPVN